MPALTARRNQGFGALYPGLRDRRFRSALIATASHAPRARDTAVTMNMCPVAPVVHAIPSGAYSAIWSIPLEGNLAPVSGGS